MYRSRINDNNNSNNNRTEDGRAVTHYFAYRKCAKISVIRSMLTLVLVRLCIKMSKKNTLDVLHVNDRAVYLCVFSNIHN